MRNALLVIDVQDSFKATDRWLQRNNPDFEKNVQRLIDGFRAASHPVVYFMDNDGDEHFNPQSPYYRLMEFLQPAAGEPVFHKYSRNCFTTTPLQQFLVRNGVTKVSITGIKTEQCCETTARLASDLGFEVDFISDATLTFPIAAPNGGRIMPAREVVERTEYALRGRFAAIRSAGEALSALA